MYTCRVATAASVQGWQIHSEASFFKIILLLVPRGARNTVIRLHYYERQQPPDVAVETVCR